MFGATWSKHSRPEIAMAQLDLSEKKTFGQKLPNWKNRVGSSSGWESKQNLS